MGNISGRSSEEERVTVTYEVGISKFLARANGKEKGNFTEFRKRCPFI